MWGVFRTRNNDDQIVKIDVAPCNPDGSTWHAVGKTREPCYCEPFLKTEEGFEPAHIHNDTEPPDEWPNWPTRRQGVRRREPGR